MSEVIEISPLDKPVTLTLFRDLSGADPKESTLKRFRDLVRPITKLERPAKRLLPLFSFARYGNLRSGKGSYRHDANVLRITAIVGDHDSGTMTLSEAERRLRKADLAGILHTTASHTAAKPRWRVICPLSGELAPDHHATLVARLNGVLGGALTSESHGVSHAWYWGHVTGVPFEIGVVDEDDL